jgi:hypothetical protein
MDAITRADMLLKMIQQLADEHPEFFDTKGPGKGDHATNRFMAEIRQRAENTFGQDFSEQKMCGDTGHKVDFYFPDEATIVEIALSLRNPTTEFEKDILKALLAQEVHPVERLVLIGKPGAVRNCTRPGRQAFIDWARRTHSLNIEVHDILNNHGL